MAQIKFLGAAGMVSGSRHLLEMSTGRVLVDCGLFQGEKQLRTRNWQRFAVPADTINAVVLTHAHIDHSGWLPRLVREGFSGPIFTSPATADLLGLMLYDSAKCQVEDAYFANRQGYSKHSPALPLYDEHDVDHTLRLVKSVPREKWSWNTNQDSIFSRCRSLQCAALQRSCCATPVRLPRLRKHLR